MELAMPVIAATPAAKAATAAHAASAEAGAEGGRWHYGTSDTCIDTFSQHKGDGVKFHGFVQTPSLMPCQNTQV